MIGIFGASGFIGRNFVDFLNEIDGDFLRFMRQDDGLYPLQTVISDFQNQSSYEKHLQSLDTVILLVSASVPSTFKDSLVSEVHYNVMPYARFLDALVTSQVKRVIYLSSGGAVYGSPQAALINEAHPTSPISNYGVGKLMIESAIRTSAALAGWDYSIFRVSNPIGKYQPTTKGQGIVAAAVSAAFSGKPIQVWGDGSALRDYVHVRDVCSAIYTAIQSNKCRNTIHNIGSGRGMSVSEVIDICRTQTELPLSINHIAQKDFLVKDILLDVSRFQSDTNWQPEHAIEDAIADFVAYYRLHA